MKSRILIALVALASPLLLGLSNEETSTCLPALDDDLEVVYHQGYVLGYSDAHEQPSWVAYHVTAAELEVDQVRTDDYRADPTVETGSAALQDYEGSGYDRGHLAPAADMTWSHEVMSESFFLSNMSPQAPSFNRGIWSKLEDQVRDWALHEGSLLVATGPILTDDLAETIGGNLVSVPKRFYKVVVDLEGEDQKGIGFILPNKGSKEYLGNFVVSIDAVEEATGLDFFADLPDHLEAALEGSANLSAWVLLASNRDTAVKRAAPQDDSKKYWINAKSNIRHNKACRWYGTSNRGYYTAEPIGTACNQCGG